MRVEGLRWTRRYGDGTRAAPASQTHGRSPSRRTDVDRKRYAPRSQRGLAHNDDLFYYARCTALMIAEKRYEPLPTTRDEEELHSSDDDDRRVMLLLRGERRPVERRALLSSTHPGFYWFGSGVLLQCRSHLQDGPPTAIPQDKRGHPYPFDDHDLKTTDNYGAFHAARGTNFHFILNDNRERGPGATIPRSLAAVSYLHTCAVANVRHGDEDEQGEIGTAHRAMERPSLRHSARSGCQPPEKGSGHDQRFMSGGGIDRTARILPSQSIHLNPTLLPLRGAELFMGQWWSSTRPRRPAEMFPPASSLVSFQDLGVRHGRSDGTGVTLPMAPRFAPRQRGWRRRREHGELLRAPDATSTTPEPTSHRSVTFQIESCRWY